MANPANSTAYRGNDGRLWLDVTENKTLDLAGAGFVQNCLLDGIVITLPATAAGLVFTIRNGGDNAASTPAGSAADGSAAVNISPQALDQISGIGLTPADNKDLINTKATSQVGDEVTLVGGDANGYTVQAARGIWAREA